MRVLVTGAAGFIGSHVCERLLARGDHVVGVDSLNDYYDPRLKRARLARLEGRPGFDFRQLDLAERNAVEGVFREHGFERVVHLAAQAGVRYSIDHPHAYVSANLAGFMNVLEPCRQHRIAHLVYASSSSVYGLNATMPFRERDAVDHPVSLYAATKKANELMAHTYSHLYRLPTTGLRFFTVYGPWGRPDMAYWTFTERILAGEPIQLFNHGKMRRDFTYVDDVAEGVVRALDRVAAPDPAFDRAHPDPAISSAPYRIYNIGNNQPVELGRFVAAIERAAGRQAIVEHLPMQPGDVEATAADVDALQRDVGFAPRTSIEDGMARFVEWFRTWRA
jgi:UDP-glucuronate 4-epimerase